MSLDASEILGATQIAATKVNPRGLGKAIMAGSSGMSAGGGLAGAAFQAVADAALGAKTANTASKQRAEAAESTAPPFKKLAFLALTADELALVELDTRTRVKLSGAVLARAPRSTVAGVEVGKSKPLIAAPITVTFADGQRWIFEVPYVDKKHAKKLAAEIG